MTRLLMTVGCCFVFSAAIVVAGVGNVLAADDQPKAAAAFLPVDLQAFANQKLDDDFHGYKGNNLKPLPRGRQKLAGVEFEIESKFIQLAGKRAPDFPEKIEGIKIGRKVDTLNFLQGTGWGSPGVDDGTEIGFFTIHYDDKETVRLPIEYGRDVRDWWALGDSDPVTRGEIAWTGANDASKNFRGLKVDIRLFKTSWKNPHPEKKVVSIDYASRNETICSPFLIGISIGTPPDDRAAVEALKDIGAFLEFDPAGRVRLVSLSGPGPVAAAIRGSDSYLVHLTNLPMVETLYANAEGITDSGMEYLAEVNSLRWLSLNLSTVSDAGLRHLSVLNNLERLRLHRTSIGDEGLAHLEKLTKLKVLDLSQTRVTDAGLPHLSKLTSLEELDLRRTTVTDAGIETLQKSLPQLKVVR